MRHSHAKTTSFLHHQLNRYMTPSIDCQQPTALHDRPLLLLPALSHALITSTNLQPTAACRPDDQLVANIHTLLHVRPSIGSNILTHCILQPEPTVNSNISAIPAAQQSTVKATESGTWPSDVLAFCSPPHFMSAAAATMYEQISRNNRDAK